MKRPDTGAESGPDIAYAFGVALGDERRVLLIGGYGCGNLGDEAILSVLLGDLRDAGADVRVVSADARATAGLHGVAAIQASPRALADALRWCDTVMIGGGGIFSGYMGRRSMLLPLLALAAQTGRRRIMFRALGAYRSTPRPVAHALCMAMERAAFVSVRDDASVDALRSFGLRRALLREPDPALRLRRAPSNTAVPAGAVGFALRRVRDPLEQHRLELECTAGLDALVRAGLTPMLLPFCAHPSQAIEQDDAYARLLQSRCNQPDAIQIATVRGPGEMLDVVARVDAIVAMRFHAIVFAHASGTPMIALPYDDKCASFAAEHGIPSLPLRDVTARALLHLLPQARAAAA